MIQNLKIGRTPIFGYAPARTAHLFHSRTCNLPNFRIAGRCGNPYTSFKSRIAKANATKQNMAIMALSVRTVRFP